MFEFKNHYQNLEDDVAEVLKKYNMTMTNVEGSFSRIISINNNPDAVHDLLKIGYSDILYSARNNKHSHILIRGDSVIYVTSHLEAHHYFG